MTDLSPAAQIAIEAWWNASDGEYIDGVWTPNKSAQLAAAIETLVDEVISDRFRTNYLTKVAPPCEDFDEYAQGYLAAHVKYRSQILAIAAELRGDTTQENNQ